MCIKMMLCSELPVTQAWRIAAMETAFGPAYRMAAGTDCMSPLDMSLLQNRIAMIVIEQVGHSHANAFPHGHYQSATGH